MLRSSSRLNIWVKIDCGLHRAGVDWQDTPGVHAIFEEVQEFPNLHPAGLLTHAGNTYSARSPEEAMAIHTETNERMRQLRSNLNIADLSISIGDTPGCSLTKTFTGIDEIRPGNFVFYDAEQLEIGSCTPSEISVAMACPVVAVHPERNEVVIFGGAVHLSKESFLHAGIASYGLAAETLSNGWGDIIPGCTITRVSQEHGIITVPPQHMTQFSPGGLAMIIPTHSCLTAHLMRRYLTLDGLTIEMMPV